MMSTSSSDLAQSTGQSRRLKKVVGDADKARLEEVLKGFLPASANIHGTLRCHLAHPDLFPFEFHVWRDGCSVGSDVTVVTYPAEEISFHGGSPSVNIFSSTESLPASGLEDLSKIVDCEQVVPLSSMDVRLFPALRRGCLRHGSIIINTEADLYVISEMGKLMTESTVPAGARVERLTVSHAHTVNAAWKFGSPAMERRITSSLQGSKCSYGVFLPPPRADRTAAAELVSWIVEQPTGAFGSLYTRPDHRGRSYAKAVTSTATREKLKRNPIAYCFIEPDNYASKKLFESLGFERVGVRAAWAVFRPFK